MEGFELLQGVDEEREDLDAFAGLGAFEEHGDGADVELEAGHLEERFGGGGVVRRGRVGVDVRFVGEDPGGAPDGGEGVAEGEAAGAEDVGGRRAGELVEDGLDGGGLRLRRVVGEPGEVVTVRRGVVLVGGMPWIADAQRAAVAGRLSAGPDSAGPGELLVLPDRRQPGDAEGWRVRRTDLVGRVGWVLLPGDLAPERIGESVR